MKPNKGERSHGSCKGVKGALFFLLVHGNLDQSMANHLDVNKAEFQSVIDHFHKELQSLRTGRASVAIVEDIRVAAYGGQSMDL